MVNCDDSGSAGSSREDSSQQMAAVPASGFWTADDVAAYLKVSSAWVWKQVRSNTGFPFVKLGTRNYRFDPVKVRAWVDRQSSEGQP